MAIVLSLALGFSWGLMRDSTPQLPGQSSLISSFHESAEIIGPSADENKLGPDTDASTDGLRTPVTPKWSDLLIEGVMPGDMKMELIEHYVKVAKIEHSENGDCSEAFSIAWVMIDKLHRDDYVLLPKDAVWAHYNVMSDKHHAVVVLPAYYHDETIVEPVVLVDVGDHPGLSLRR